MSEPSSHFYSCQGLRLHYVDWGNPGSPPLLLIHGGEDHARSWDEVARQFSDHRVLAPDLRGHGDSDWARGSSYPFEASIYDLAELIGQNQLPPVDIVAHSLGGAISLVYAGAFPETVRRLVVVEGWWWSPKRLRQISQEPMDERLGKWVNQLRNIDARPPRRYASIDEGMARMMEQNRRLSPGQARHLTLHAMRRNEDGTFSWKFDPHVRVRSPHKFAEADVRRLWGRIACPVLLLRGADSFASDPREEGAMEHLPAARVATIDEAGHWPHHDRPGEFVRVVREFLSA